MTLAGSGGDELAADRPAQPRFRSARHLPGGQRNRERVLFDRREELAAIDSLLNAVREGFSGTLVLRGGPGVGKTRLLEYAIEEGACRPEPGERR